MMMKIVTLHIEDERHPLVSLARHLRECVAVNHGATQLVVNLPDGTKEVYAVHPGATERGYRNYLSQLNWTKH
jgi:hypothetical protein